MATTSVRQRTEFGNILEEYRHRAGFSQEEFAERMREAGYPTFSQRLASYLLYNKAARVYSNFFKVAPEVLRLDRFEKDRLLEAWLSLEGKTEENGEEEEE
jgi:transcriptional regulator with XRE-family HTH domain